MYIYTHTLVFFFQHLIFQLVTIMSVYVSVIIYIVEQLGQTSIYLCIKESRLISDMKVKSKCLTLCKVLKLELNF